MPDPNVSLEIPHLDEEERIISDDINVIPVVFQRMVIAFDRLAIVLLASVQKTIHMPADVGRKVKTQACFDKDVSFGGSIEVGQEESFHGCGLAMRRKLFQDCLGCLETLLVLHRLDGFPDLLMFVEAKDAFE